MQSKRKYGVLDIDPSQNNIIDVLGGELLEHPLGRFYLIRSRAGAICPEAEEIADDYVAAVSGSTCRTRPEKLSNGLRRLLFNPPEEALFFDIETCGLRNATIFLVGIMQYRHGRMEVEQYLAGDYGEEAACLSSSLRKLSVGGTWVSFNGLRFDWPLLAGRAKKHGISGSQPRPHLDLLVEALLRWRRELPNCALQTLEKYLCRPLSAESRRYGDIPSRFIPRAYRDYLSTGDAGILQPIVYHNFLDLLAMVELAAIMLTGVEPARE
jgi:uncharacterized protein YprB with RNaseH-like and TPR domain